MKPIFTRTDQEFIIYINRHLAKNRYVVLALALALGLVCYGLFWWNPGFFSWAGSSVFWWLYGLYVAGLLTWSILSNEKKIVFSAPDQQVYSQTAWAKKKRMAFRDIGAIKPFGNSFGVTYFALYSKNNLFQRHALRVSPPFRASKQGDRDYADFDRTILPTLWAFVNSRQNSPPIQPNLITGNALTYFHKEGSIYGLKSTYNRDSLSKVLIAFLLGVSVFILLSPSLRLHLINYGLGSGIAAGILWFIYTEKKYFQDGQLFSEYQSGLFRRSYPLAGFITYQVTHRKHNFVYVGTDISLVFAESVSRSPVFLCRMYKTEKIDALIRETNYIIAQQLPHRA